MSHLSQFDFRFHTEVPLRFRDLDALLHVNHAAYLTLLEQARMVYMTEVLGWEIPVDLNNWVLAEISCKYRSPIKLQDGIKIWIKTAWMRNSSFGCVYEIVKWPDQQLAALGEFVQVHVSTETGRAQPITDDLRTRISEYEDISRNSAVAKN